MASRTSSALPPRWPPGCGASRRPSRARRVTHRGGEVGATARARRRRPRRSGPVGGRRACRLGGGHPSRDRRTTPRRRRRVLLARIADLDREHVVAAGEVEQRPAPVARAAEVRHDRDERTLAGDGAEQRERGARSPRRPGRASSPSASRTPTRPARPCRGGSGVGEPPRTTTRPTRLPRTLAAWPRASAIPSATSALRRSAVPNPIDGVRSSTTHVTSTRSASCTLTCGSRVRAVTFQSISRTSSPGT